MLNILLVIKALCGAPHDAAPVCAVRWATMPSGEETVLIGNYNKTDYVICRIINTADSECLYFSKDQQ